MNAITALYTALILVSVYTCGYSIWCYYECPNTRSHRPYVFPIFVSVGWFFFAMNGLITIAAGKGTRMDGYAVLLLSVATLVALLIFVYHYRRGRKNETIRETCIIHKDAS